MHFAGQVAVAAPGYAAASNSCVAATTTEFFEIDEAVPLPKLDTPDMNLLRQELTPVQKQNFDALTSEMQALLNTQRPACPGDGNMDGVVDEADRRQWQYFNANGGGSSWYDFNLDGKTDGADLSTIRENLGKVCLK